eukprot:TRINITY_DN15851_c0_g1_i1.p1 TRINITY_DN15851_c0_g1~~TRINITY_DN15851_c0_g1_i1.p1  ORF type:complete len:134 (+),score=26.20 TRINITY_DN15851_c0_g1_i1:213-614(+)
MPGCGDDCGCGSSTAVIAPAVLEVVGEEEATSTYGGVTQHSFVEPKRRSSTDDVLGGGGHDDDVDYIQSLTNNEHSQRRQVVENLGYKTALEELAGERYGIAYFAAQEKGWNEGHNDAVRVMTALLGAAPHKK